MRGIRASGGAPSNHRSVLFRPGRFRAHVPTSRTSLLTTGSMVAGSAIGFMDLALGLIRGSNLGGGVWLLGSAPLSRLYVGLSCTVPANSLTIHSLSPRISRVRQSISESSAERNSRTFCRRRPIGPDLGSVSSAIAWATFSWHARLSSASFTWRSSEGSKGGIGRTSKGRRWISRAPKLPFV